jgi:phosphatidylserine/phosphatidylglycerophosphate/cardiolipin synthase-like enzyme
MEVSVHMLCSRLRHSIVLSHLLPILFAAAWASAEPALAAPVPQAYVQSGPASAANPPTGELAPPPQSLVITPSAIGIVAGEPQLLRLSDDRGRHVREAVWTVSDPARADLKVNGDAVITGLVPGKLTVTATWRGLTAQARVTVLHSPSLYQGTAQMSEYPHVRPTAPAAVTGPVAVEAPYRPVQGKDVCFRHCAERIVAAINDTRNSLDLAIFALTHPAITAALEEAQRRGVQIRIVADQLQAKGKYSKIPYLISRGVAVQLRGGYKGGRSVMHDKFAIFDGRLVVTGSFNWTISADTSNAENADFFSDPAKVARYAKEFERLWSSAP